MDIMVPKATITETNTLIDVAEELSHCPHSDRREFLEQVHSAYQETRCMAQINTKLSTCRYYAHLQDAAYRLVTVLLHFDMSKNTFLYYLILTK